MESLPHYTVRPSARAKRVSIRVSPRTGVEVVLPVKLKRFNIDKFVRQNQAWIEQQLQAQASRQPIEAPESIPLRAIEVTIPIHYEADDKPPILLRNQEAPLIIRGDRDNTSVIATLLRRWLVAKAKDVLPPWLETISHEAQLPFSKTTIRCQKSLWGSCSRKHDISLNAKALLLPRPLTQHLFMHELCHTVHFDHSKAFWQLLTQLDPLAHQHNSALKLADQWMPWWSHH